jgi:hypothetical protein
LTSPDSVEYLIKTDSISVPDTVTAGAPLQVKFHGYLGNNGCYRFKEFRLQRSAIGIFVEPVGVHPSGHPTCTDNIPAFEKTLTIEPPFTDPFLIRVSQPRATVLERTVRIK